MTTRPAAARPPALEKPRVKKILSLLTREYPDATCALVYSTPLELLVATMLSAQCTDARVNQVTGVLFRKYRSVHDYAAAPLAELEADIRSTGFYRNKARAIRACCAELIAHHGGNVPSTLDELVKLPGVGRKTANVVLGQVFDTPGITVDTHVRRLSQRLGLTQKNDPDKIEQDLMKVVPHDQWSAFSLRLIQHGRTVCKARSPRCHHCPLLNSCPHGLSRV